MKQSTRIWLGMGVGCGAFVAISYAIFRTSDIGRASAELEDARADARKAGLPLTLADFYRIFPPAKDSENAAPLYQAAFKLQKPIYKDLKLDWKWLDFAAGRLTKTQREALTEFQRRARPAMALIKRASQLPSLDYHRDWSQGATLLLPEFADHKNWAKRFCEQAILRASPDQAKEDLEVAVRMARQVGCEPTLIAVLIQITIETSILSTVNVLSLRGQRWAEAMDEVLDELGPLPKLRPTVQSEFFLHLNTLARYQRSPERLKAELGTDHREMKLVRFNQIARSFETRILQHYTAILQSLPADESNFMQLEKGLDQTFSNRLSDAWLREVSVGDLISRANIFTVDTVRAHSMRRALTRYAIDRQLGRAVSLPADFFGKGLVKINGNLIYSVGINGKDEGGSNRMGADDIAVRFR